MFSMTGSALRSGADRYSLYCLVLAIVAGLGGFCFNFGFGRSCERLAALLRLRILESILCQEVRLLPFLKYFCSALPSYFRYPFLTTSQTQPAI